MIKWIQDDSSGIKPSNIIKHHQTSGKKTGLNMIN